MSKYSHIKLSQAFRPYVLHSLRNMKEFKPYREKNGLVASSMTTPQIHEACEALGFDLNAEFVAFHTRNPQPSPDYVDDQGDQGDQGDNAGGDLDQGDQGETEQEDIESMSDQMAHAAAGAAAINAAAPRDASPFEGKAIEDIIGDILAPAGVHLTPYLQQALPGLLKPLAEVAARGPRVITNTVVQGPPPAPGAWVPPAVNVKGWAPLRQAFGLKKSEGNPGVAYALDNLRVAICDYAGIEAPKVDPDYVWNAETLAILAGHDASGENAWIHGPAGTGKTEGVIQYAARTGRPFVRIAIDRGTEPADIIGFSAPAGKDTGGTVWQDGKLTRAFRTPYCVILIDEITLLRSGALAIFQTALDRSRCLHLPTGEIVHAAQGVFVVAADNTAGVGDDSGRYVDTAAVNAALSDRFAAKLPFDYMPAAREAGMIAARSGLPKEAARIMSDYADLTRSKATAGQLTLGVTPRRLLGWANLVKVGIGSAKAFNACVIQGCAPEDREALLMLETASLKSDHDKIDGLARGTWVAPVTPAAAPLAPSTPTGAGNRFPADEQL